VTTSNIEPMATITGPNNDGPHDYTKTTAFQGLLSRITKLGTSRLPQQDTVAIAEIARLKAAHPDPRTRSSFAKAYDQIARAHLEHCLRLNR